MGAQSDKTMSYLDYDYSCCEAKVDPISLLVTIGAIAAVSWFLRQAVIDNNVMMAKKRRKKRHFFPIIEGQLENFLRKIDS